MEISIQLVDDVCCPICGSDVIKHHKVHVDGQWWSRCISGIDHGIVIKPDGTEVDIGVDYENIYFNDDGLIEYQKAPYFSGHVTFQEYREM